MKPTIAKELVLDALMRAGWQRKPKQQVILHSDQGSQYVRNDQKRVCDANRLLLSISRSGNCCNDLGFCNAVAEPSFSFVKKERICKLIYKTRDLSRFDAMPLATSGFVLSNQASQPSGWNQCYGICTCSIQVRVYLRNRAKVTFQTSLVISISWFLCNSQLMRLYINYDQMYYDENRL